MQCSRHVNLRYQIRISAGLPSILTQFSVVVLVLPKQILAQYVTKRHARLLLNHYQLTIHDHLSISFDVILYKLAETAPLYCITNSLYEEERATNNAQTAQVRIFCSLFTV